MALPFIMEISVLGLNVFQFNQDTTGNKITKNTVGNFPRLPLKFTMNWTIYYNRFEQPIPPYNSAPPAPYEIGRGYSYYDFWLPGMIEHFDDFCLPIFSADFHWPCTFFNRLNVAYLLSPSWAPYGPCCVYRKPWWPPAPDFLKVVPYNRTEVYHDKIVDWYVLTGKNPAPFGYGFYWDKIKNSQVKIPAAFWFRGNQGWLNQDFYNFTDKLSSKVKFDLPTECVNAAMCIFVP